MLGRPAFHDVILLGESKVRNAHGAQDRETPEPPQEDTVANTHEDDRIIKIASLRDQLRDATRPIAARLGAMAVWRRSSHRGLPPYLSES